MATINDELWLLGRRSHSLTEFLSELRIIWNDSAAQEISTRYLVPRSDDDQRMQRDLADQQSALEELQGRIATVVELASAAERLSQEIAQLLYKTLQEASTANGYYQSFSEFNNNASNLFPQIQEKISYASSSCSGISSASEYAKNESIGTSSSGDLQEKTSMPLGSLERDDGLKLNEQIEGGVPRGYDGHHLIGINEAKDSIALQKAVNVGYNINNGHNGIALPTTVEESEKTGLPLHNGRHLAEYTNHVSKWLEILDEGFIRAQEIGKPLSQEEILERISAIEDAIRNEILLHKISLQNNDPNRKP